MADMLLLLLLLLLQVVCVTYGGMALRADALTCNPTASYMADMLLLLLLLLQVVYVAYGGMALGADALKRHHRMLRLPWVITKVGPAAAACRS